jgi:type IV pilus assembly protein PilM
VAFRRGFLNRINKMFHLFKKKYGLGVDISNHSIEAFSLTVRGDIKGYERIVLDGGIIKDGRVKDKRELAEKLREVLDSVSPVQHRSGRRSFQASKHKGRVVVSIPELNIFLHYWKIPEEVSAKGLRDFVRENARKLIPFAENAIYWDMIPVSNGVLYAAAEKEVIDEYVEVMRLAGIERYVFDSESLSLGRAFLSEERFDELRKNHNLPSSVMIIDIGGRTTNVGIWNSHNVLCLSVTIPIAGNHFTQTIKEKFNISESEAEKLKRTIGFDYKKGDNRTVVVLQLQSDLQKILQEVWSALSYYEEEYGEKVVEVLLSGGSALVPQIDSYIATNLDRDVRIGDPLPRINTNGGAIMKRESAVLFSNAIGLALRGITEKEDGIDLSPRLEKPSFALFHSQDFSAHLHRAVKIFFGCAFALAVLGAAWKYMYLPKTEITPAPLPPTPMPAADAPPPAESNFSAASTEPLSTIDALSSTTESDTLIRDTSFEEREKIVVTDTPTGWLNVREDSDVGSRQITRVFPGQSFVLIEKTNEWYKIELEDGASGWISARYAK